jgi:hypothetical protein
MVSNLNYKKKKKRRRISAVNESRKMEWWLEKDKGQGKVDIGNNLDNTYA